MGTIIYSPRMSNALQEASFDKFGSLIKHGDLLGIRAFISSGANVDARNRFGWTPLMLAVSKGHGPIIDFLISAGADVNAANGFGGSPLAYASLEGRLDVIESLLKAGADVNVQPHGVSLLEFAVRGGGRFRTRAHFERLQEAGVK